MSALTRIRPLALPMPGYDLISRNDNKILAWAGMTTHAVAVGIILTLAALAISPILAIVVGIAAAVTALSISVSAGMLIGEAYGATWQDENWFLYAAPSYRISRRIKKIAGNYDTQNIRCALQKAETRGMPLRTQRGLARQWLLLHHEEQLLESAKGFDHDLQEKARAEVVQQKREIEELIRNYTKSSSQSCFGKVQEQRRLQKCEKVLTLRAAQAMQREDVQEKQLALQKAQIELEQALAK